MLKSDRNHHVLATWDRFCAKDEVIESIDDLFDFFHKRQKGRIQTVNLQHVYVASKGAEHHKDLQEATVVTADGWPLAWYTNRRHSKKIDRVTGRGALELILGGSTPHWRIATIGGTSETGDAFAAALAESGKDVVYRNEGIIRDSDFTQIVDDIAGAKPDLILTALGAPRGETLGRLIHERTDINAIVVGVGGAIEMWNGNTPAAPSWVQALRGEWLYRLAREPRRLFRRYIVECPPVILAMISRLQSVRPNQQ